jgi:hypothetical protein
MKHSRERDNKASGFVRDGEFLKEVHDYQLIKMESAHGDNNNNNNDYNSLIRRV